MVAAFEESPAFLAVLRGPDYVIESANQRMKQLLGERQIIGRPLHAALPEVVDQGVIKLLDQVRLSGEPFVGQAIRLTLERPSRTSPMSRCWISSTSRCAMTPARSMPSWCTASM